MQLHELQKHLLSKYISYEDKNIEEGIDRFLADNPEHKAKAAIDKKIEKLKQAYNELNQKIEEIKREECSNIIDLLKQQFIISPSIENYLGSENRVNVGLAPYTAKENNPRKHYDSLHWEIILNSKEIPEGSALYIYTKDKGFFRNNTHNLGLHPLLIQEWSVLKKGELKLYMHTEGDKKFCPAEAQENVSEPQQEIYPSFYVDRVLESPEMKEYPRQRIIEKLLSSIYRSMDKGLDYETEDLFDELFYQIKRAQRTTGGFNPVLSSIELKAQMLYDKYKNMW